MKGWIWLVVAVLVGWSGLVAAQELDQSIASPYFDCPYVNYFDSECPQLREDERRRGEVRRAREREEDRDREVEEERERRGDGEREDGILPDEAILFPRESMAADAPPLYRWLLENPTLENARRFVVWHARRTARVSAVQALIKEAGEEIKRELAGAAEVGGRP